MKGLIFCLCKTCKNLSASSISQSLKDLRKIGFQPPSPLLRSHSFAAGAFFLVVSLNKLGKARLSVSSPHQTSLQKLILLLSPREIEAFWRSRGHSFLISFHNPTPKPPLILPEHQPPVPSPNLLLMTFLQREFLSLANR